MRTNVVQLPNCGKLSPVVSRPKNSEVRSREYLTLEEVKALRDAAKGVGRHGLRDYAIILITYRHALRVSELVDLRWEQVGLCECSLTRQSEEERKA